MDHKQPILHELLQQHQEPFHLKTYISYKRSHSLSHSHLNNSSPPESFFLHVPSSTAAALAEAATRIQKQRQTQIKNVGATLIGSFLKILKHRGARRRVERNCDLKVRENPEEIRISSSCSRDDIHFRASATASFHDTAEFEARFGSSPISPFIFSPLRSPTSFSGRRTPDLGSPATSPFRRVKQEGVVIVNNGVEEEKEQCSPVCVLDAPYEDEEHQSLVGEEDEDEDDYHLHPIPSYANIERATQKLLERLERFEKLAELEQVDLEQKLLEASEEECDIKGSVGFEQCRKESSSLKESRMKRVICEDKSKIVLWRRDAIDMMVEVEFKTAAQVEETAAELEIAIFDELMEQCFCIDVYVTT